MKGIENLNPELIIEDMITEQVNNLVEATIHNKTKELECCINNAELFWKDENLFFETIEEKRLELVNILAKTHQSEDPEASFVEATKKVHALIQRIVQVKR